jgi:NAD(P)-dependent dehydrogenase (short-subunit alcohol dehydrogenase family)
MKLAEHSVLVTGGGCRIGRAICKALASLGAGVIVHYHHSGDDARTLCDEICADGGWAKALQADLGDVVACRQLIRQAASFARPLVGLVNNAAVFFKDRIGGFDGETMAHQWAVNVQAPMVLSESFIETVEKGVIVNLLDRRITGRDTEAVSYVLTKKALAAFTGICAKAAAPGVRVNAVAPGAVLPPVVGGTANAVEPAGAVPLACTVTVEDVANAVCYLVTAPAVTGQILYVDGGQHFEPSLQ